MSRKTKAREEIRHLPSQGETKMPSEQTGPNPTDHTQQSTQRSRLYVHAHIEPGVQESEKEAQIQEQAMARQETLGLNAE